MLEREKWQNYELPIDNTPLDQLLLKSQQFCVVQFSHAGSSIRSSDAKPWLRCIAFCESLDSAYSVARAAYDKGEKMETRIVPAGKCTLVPRSKRLKGDFDAMLRDQTKANEQFDAHVANRKAILSKTEVTSEPKVAAPAKPENAQNEAPVISAEFGRPDEAFMQSYAAFAIIQDPNEAEDEPVIIPLFADESMEALAKRVKTVSHNVDLVHVDIHCGRVLEWLPLHKPRAAETIHKHPLRQSFEEKIKWIGTEA